mmetsp:Transcript_99693/g.222762  ORF Transcript_99693/g.222762 Transcript_99693/m.222762 type:complete len:188 (-) Transcript_99693:974-1537(-)
MVAAVLSRPMLLCRCTPGVTSRVAKTGDAKRFPVLAWRVTRGVGERTGGAAVATVATATAGRAGPARLEFGAVGALTKRVTEEVHVAIETAFAETAAPTDRAAWVEPGAAQRWGAAACWTPMAGHQAAPPGALAPVAGAGPMLMELPVTCQDDPPSVPVAWDPTGNDMLAPPVDASATAGGDQTGTA